MAARVFGARCWDHWRFRVCVSNALGGPESVRFGVDDVPRMFVLLLEPSDPLALISPDYTTSHRLLCLDNPALHHCCAASPLNAHHIAKHPLTLTPHTPPAQHAPHILDAPVARADCLADPEPTAASFLHQGRSSVRQGQPWYVAVIFTTQCMPICYATRQR